MSASASASRRPSEPAADGGRAVCVRWSVSRAALARVCSAIEPGPGVVGVSLTIDFGADGGGRSVLEAAGVELWGERHAPGHARVSRDARRGLEHLDIEGVVSCTRRGGEAVYVRAPILARLGLEGGRYELAPTKDADR